MPGPLTGLKIIEMAGIGPGPFCGMMLADHGAEVIRIDRPGARPEPVLGRNRRSVVVNVKTPEGVDIVRRLAKGADGFFEGLRPGVMERLGLGPDTLIADNPKLVYGRMTGWG
ncbi:MAG: CoA transferase, partial [Pseudomonadota bacterium]